MIFLLFLFVVIINPLLLSGLVRWGYLSVMILRMINDNGRKEQHWIILSPWPSGQRWGIQSDMILGSHRDMSSICSWKIPKEILQCLPDSILILHFNWWMYRLIIRSVYLVSDWMLYCNYITLVRCQQCPTVVSFHPHTGPNCPSGV